MEVDGEKIKRKFIKVLDAVVLPNGIPKMWGGRYSADRYSSRRFSTYTLRGRIQGMEEIAHPGILGAALFHHNIIRILDPNEHLCNVYIDSLK